MSFLILIPQCKNGTGSDSDNMDTTSHNFTWQIEMFGKYPSYLNDVSIVDENNILAVGEVFTDSGIYNLAKWNGENWHLVDIDLKQPVHGILSLDSDQIWAASGILHFWNGIFWKKYHLWRMNVLSDSDGSLNAIWAQDSSNVFFIGEKGTIVFYNGSRFNKMSSQTNIRLRRIFGNKSGNIYISGYDENGQGVVLEYDNNAWKTKFVTMGLPNPQTNDIGIVSAVWCTENYAYFTSLSGLVKIDLSSNKETIINEYRQIVSPFAEHDIEGQSDNDFIIIGNRGKLVHWNGISWSYQNSIYDEYPNHIISVTGADYNKEVIAFVGFYNEGQKCFIVIGKHSELKE